VKIENSFIKSLIEENNPIPYVWRSLFNIWLRHANGDLKNYYYSGEESAFLFEDFLLKAFDEFFTKELPKACLNEPSPFQNVTDESCFIIMDGMSIREGILIFKALQKEGFVSKISYSFSAIPSDTQSFKEKIKSDLSDSGKFIEINHPKKIRISGQEKYIWSYFPDVMLDKIQIGRTVISDLENMYKTSEKIVFELLSKINSKRIIILSDHGYLRSEPGFSFSVPESIKKKLRGTFGGSRFITMDKINLSELVNDGYIMEFSGYYLVKSRYVWPVSGKYNIYLHGGVSLMECFTPVIEVEK
jgi:ribosomal protein S8